MSGCTTSAPRFNPPNETQLGSTTYLLRARTLLPGTYQQIATVPFTRGSDSTNQRIRLHATFTLPVNGHTNVGWNSYEQAGCTRSGDNLTIDCVYWSVPYTHVPYPCGDTTDTSPETIGLQPGGCADSALVSEEVESALDEPDAVPAPESTAPDQPGTGLGDTAANDDEEDSLRLVPKGQGSTAADDVSALASARSALTCRMASAQRHSRLRAGAHDYFFNGTFNCIGNAPTPYFSGRATLYRQHKDGTRTVASLGDYIQDFAYFVESDNVYRTTKREAFRVQLSWSVEAPPGYKFVYGLQGCSLVTATLARCFRWGKKFR